MGGALERASKLDEEGGSAVTCMSVFELYVGTYAFGPRLRSRSVAELKALLDRFEILDLDSFSAERGAGSSLSRGGRAIRLGRTKA